MGSKNKSVSSSEKSQGGKDKTKKDKKDHTDKKEVAVFINEEEASKIFKSNYNSRFSKTSKCENFNCKCIS